MRAAQADDPGDGRQGDHRGDPGADRARSSTTSSRPRTSARWRASSPGTRSSSSPRSSARSRASGCWSASSSSGVGFEELKGRPQAERDRIGEIVFRFFLGCLYRHRQFSGDPHPGQLPAARRRPRRVPGLRAVQAHGRRPRSSSSSPPSGRSWRATRAALHELLAESGFLPEPERVDPEHLLAFIEDAIWWYTTADETVQLTPEIATQVMIESSDPRSSHFREMRHQDMRPEHLFGRRMEMLTLAVLSQLRRARQLAQDRPRVDVRR